MRTNKSGPLESGSREVRYVLMDDRGWIRGHADTLQDARVRRESLPGYPSGDIYVVREERTVAPDDMDEPNADLGARADGGQPKDARIPVTLRDDAHVGVRATETCDGADGHDCVREDPTLTRGEDRINLKQYGPGSDRAGERRVLCSDCREKQDAVQLAEMPTIAGLYSTEEINHLRDRFPDVLADAELETGDGDE